MAFNTFSLFSYNMTTVMTITKMLQDESGAMIFSQGSQVFAAVKLTNQLNEDTDAGKYQHLFTVLTYRYIPCHYNESVISENIIKTTVIILI